jgi:hypothetical protein
MFLVGCARSGTTLLKRMLNAHPEIAFPRETHWIPTWYEDRIGLSSDGTVTPELITKLMDYPRFTRMGIERAHLEGLLAGASRVPYARFVSGIFELYGESVGKPLVGEKTPGYVRSLPTLHSLWPRARFVHLIRDGRDVCLSLLDWNRAPRNVGRFVTWEEDPLSTAALWWEWQVRLGLEAGAEIGTSLYREVRYEALVADPEATCRSVCGFLGVPYSESMVRYNEGRGKRRPAASAKRSWLPATAGLRDWRTQMAAQDLERFDAVAGNLLEDLGYERPVSGPGARARARAAELRRRFAEDALRRDRRLPQRWKEWLS